MPRMTKFTVLLLSILVTIAPTTPVHAQETDENTQSAVTTLLTQEFTLNQITDDQTQTDALQDVVIGAANVSLDQPRTLQALAEQMVTDQFGKGQFKAFAQIVTHESNWNPQAINRSSGACGLGQALPCTKIADHSPKGQLAWMIDYIAQRYGTPAYAWAVWQRQGWY